VSFGDHVPYLHDNISEGDIKGFVFNITQKFTNLLVQLSIFLIDLFVGTYRLSSHAWLEAFVIQTKLNLFACVGTQKGCAEHCLLLMGKGGKFDLLRF
jgi:hypothetical protein